VRSLLINECPEAGLSLLFISETEEDAEGRVGVEVVVGSKALLLLFGMAPNADELVKFPSQNFLCLDDDVKVEKD